MSDTKTVPHRTANEYRALLDGHQAIAAFYFALSETRTASDVSCLRGAISDFAALVTKLADDAAEREESFTKGGL